MYLICRFHNNTRNFITVQSDRSMLIVNKHCANIAPIAADTLYFKVDSWEGHGGCPLNRSFTVICFQQKYQERSTIAEYPLHQLICIRLLEIHIALSSPKIDVRTFAQGYCVAIASLFRLWLWTGQWTRWNFQSLAHQARNWMNWFWFFDFARFC